MQNQIDNIENDVKEIKEALLGNEYGNKGIINRVSNLESYQQKDKKHKWMIAGGAAVIGFLVKFWDKIIH